MAKSYIKNMKDKLPGITWKVLRRADRTMKGPFTLVLNDTDAPLVCEEVIRIIPGKRLVAFAIWGDQEVAVKLFYEKGKSKRDCQRDVFGSETLMQANVPTPKLLFKGTADKRKRIHVLIYQKITQAKSIETLWQEKPNPQALLPLLRAVTIEIATQHVLGILQVDLHLKNFLVTEKNIYTLDGGKIARFEQPLDKKISMEYLSLFLVQLGVGVSDIQKQLFDLYTKSRGWLLKPSDIRYFEKMLAKNNKERWQRYRKKIFRTCSAFKRLDKYNKTIVYDRNYESAAFFDFLQNPDATFQQSSTIYMKKGNSATVAKIMIDDRAYVVKRYNIKNIFHWLRRCLRPTRAVKSWRLSQHLYAMGVATAKPIAFIEKRFLGLRSQSYFLMEYVDGQNIGDYFATHSEDKQMAENVLVLFNHLAELHITHGDLKMTNILVEKDRPVLIDLDAMQEHRLSASFRHSVQSELKRFMRNWQERPPIYHLFNELLK